MKQTSEAAFETAIEAVLLNDGYSKLASGAFDTERVLQALTKWLDTHGVLTTLRHGFKCFGKTLRIAFFRPAHVEARYRANRLGITRQIYFSSKNKKSLDVVLSVNGIPVVTLELKNPLSGRKLTARLLIGFPFLTMMDMSYFLTWS